MIYIRTLHFVYMYHAHRTMHGDGDSSDHARIQCEMTEAYSSFALLYKDKALDPSPFIHSEHAQDEYSLYESSMQKGR